MPHTRRLFQSDLVTLEAYECRGGPVERSPEEWSDRPEVVFPCSGAFVRHSPLGRALADPNHVLFFPAGQPYQVSHPVPGGDRCVIVAPSVELYADVVPALDPGVGHALVDPAARFRLGRLLQAVRRGAPLDGLWVEEESLAVLASASRSAAERSEPNRPARRAEVALADHAQWVLNSRYRERLSLGELARAVHVSPYHLCRVFRRSVGVSIHHYLTRLRLLGWLEHLLEDPGAEIAPLALDYGFASHSHGSTAFRRAFGVPPSQLRRRPPAA